MSSLLFFNIPCSATSLPHCSWKCSSRSPMNPPSQIQELFFFPYLTIHTECCLPPAPSNSLSLTSCSPGLHFAGFSLTSLATASGTSLLALPPAANAWQWGSSGCSPDPPSFYCMSFCPCPRSKQHTDTEDAHAYKSDSDLSFEPETQISTPYLTLPLADNVTQT